MLTYLLLGVIQGLTEFLPVSSSAHLVLVQHWLGVNPPGAVVEVALHLATLLSVVIVYRYDIAAIFSKQRWGYLGLLVLATVVTVALALPAKDWIEALTDAPYAPRVVGALLLITALWLVLADRRLRRQAAHDEPAALEAGLIGVAQAIAVLPGISRSGATIGAACSASAASGGAQLPAVGAGRSGAGVLKAGDLAAALSNGAVSALGLGLGFVAALLCGVLAIYVVLWLLKRARLSYFAAYCALLGVAALIIG
jgi:undecaprenyl-diphosphatase